MGICASAPSAIHDDDFGDGSVVNHSETSKNGSSHIDSIYTQAGTKGENQDSSIIFQGYGIEDGIFCAVFDGHGENGHIVSKLVRNRMPSLLLKHRNAIGKIEKLEADESSPSKNFHKWKYAFLSAFKQMDKEIKLLEATLDFSCSGTTAVAVVKHGDDLVIANLGDSRAVLATRSDNGISTVQLTTDLKPGVPSEAERIRKCNGRVLALKEESHIQRVWLPHKDSPGLAMSRAFGDFMLKNHGIIAIPDLSYHHLCANDDFLVLASDGVWDVLNNDQVMEIVSTMANGEEAAKAVVDAAMCSWRERFPNSKRDDCTAICLFLQTKS